MRQQLKQVTKFTYGHGRKVYIHGNKTLGIGGLCLLTNKEGVALISRKRAAKLLKLWYQAQGCEGGKTQGEENVK